MRGFDCIEVFGILSHLGIWREVTRISDGVLKDIVLYFETPWLDQLIDDSYVDKSLLQTTVKARVGDYGITNKAEGISSSSQVF
jgi:hypothetical protein